MAEKLSSVFIGIGKRNGFYYVWRRRVFIFLLAVELRKIEGLLTGVRSGNRNSILEVICGKANRALQKAALFKHTPPQHFSFYSSVNSCTIIERKLKPKINVNFLIKLDNWSAKAFWKHEPPFLYTNKNLHTVGRDSDNCTICIFHRGHTGSDLIRFTSFHQKLHMNFAWACRLSVSTLTGTHANNALKANGVAQDSTELLD